MLFCFLVWHNLKQVSRFLFVSMLNSTEHEISNVDNRSRGFYLFPCSTQLSMKFPMLITGLEVFICFHAQLN